MEDTLTGRLTDLITKPSRLMDRVGEAPRWIPAILLIMVIMAAATWFITPISEPESLELMRDSPIMRMMTEEQWQAQYEKALNPSTTKLLFSSLRGGFLAGVVALMGGVILGFFARLSGGQGTTRQAIGIMAWSSVISVGLGTLAKLPLMLITESTFQSTISLAALLPELAPSSTLYLVLAYFTDFFTWWSLVVLIIGFERVFQLNRVPAALTVLLPWALVMAAAVGLNMLLM